MPSLREKVTTYFRQLSFIADPRDGIGRHYSPRKVAEDTFITKYLEGRLETIFTPGPDIKSGQNPKDLPDLSLAFYPTGPNTITAAYTGPDEGLTGVKRSKLHLSGGSDIDFIDTNQEQDLEIRKSASIQKFRNSSIPKFTRPCTAAATGGGGDQNANTNNNNNNNNTAAGNNMPPTSQNSSYKAVNRSRKNSRTGDTMAGDANKTIGGSVDNEKPTGFISVSSGVADTDDNKHHQLFKIVTDHKTNEAVNLPPASALEFGKENVSPNDCKMESHHPVLERVISQSQCSSILSEPIAGVKNWNLENEHAYGISVSLYEKNFLTNEPMGSPIADCFGIVVRGNSAVMALADGVNWGDGARLAARSAVQGSLDYLDTAIFGVSQGCMATTTRDVFISLLRSIWEAQACILEVGGALSTLSIAVVLPLDNPNRGKYVVCACNVGDSLGYVYSKKHGVREFTQASHDTTSMRDMRDALGALGPVDGNKPELRNLTLSMTLVDSGDIVFLTSDGVSDNFDPVVGKFSEPYATNHVAVLPQLAPKRQNKSASVLYGRSVSTESSQASSSGSSSSASTPIRPPRSKKSAVLISNSAGHNQNTRTEAVPTSTTAAPSRPKYMRSHTVIEPRVSLNKSPIIKYPRSAAGLPFVTGIQRHQLTLLRLEDLLSYGINGALHPCPSARKLSHLLIDFVKMITSARRKTLEQRELFFKVVTKADGRREEVELTRLQHRAARKRIVDSNTFQSLPGKLDHASVCAFTVGSGLQPTEFNETSF